MLNGKRGWIRIVEAFVAILLILGVLLIVINKGYIGKKDISKQVYDAEISILREIELNDNSRKEILSLTLDEKGVVVTEENLPNIYQTIMERSPEYLECNARVCELDKICIIENIDKDVYAQAVAISATNEIYKPRQLKLFCWVV
ncbi:MAG: hypothetical protein WC584_02145 [Candidatus Pacearchaeota archaeon]